MDLASQLALMDLNMQEMHREDARTTPGGFIVERDALVCCGSPHGTDFTNVVLVAGSVTTAQVREHLGRVFGDLPCSVWTRAHVDSALADELQNHGFLELLSVPAMAFREGDGTPAPTPPELTLRPVRSPADCRAYHDVMTDAWSVYGETFESTAPPPRAERLIGGSKQAVLAWREGVAVAGATLYLSHGIGGIGWVGTRRDAVGRGYGAAVTWAVVQEGLHRGVALLSLQASPLGEPVYRRMGFTTPSHYRVFVVQR